MGSYLFDPTLNYCLSLVILRDDIKTGLMRILRCKICWREGPNPQYFRIIQHIMIFKEYHLFCALEAQTTLRHIQNNWWHSKTLEIHGYFDTNDLHNFHNAKKFVCSPARNLCRVVGPNRCNCTKTLIAQKFNKLKKRDLVCAKRKPKVWFMYPEILKTITLKQILYVPKFCKNHVFCHVLKKIEGFDFFSILQCRKTTQYRWPLFPLSLQLSSRSLDLGKPPFLGLVSTLFM